jgi:hypothetical protein
VHSNALLVKQLRLEWTTEIGKDYVTLQTKKQYITYDKKMDMMHKIPVELGLYSRGLQTLWRENSKNM